VGAREREIERERDVDVGMLRAEHLSNRDFFDIDESVLTGPPSPLSHANSRARALSSSKGLKT
jgi:hypothetical protein